MTETAAANGPPARPPPTIKLDSFTSILLVDRREKR